MGKGLSAFLSISSNNDLRVPGIFLKGLLFRSLKCTHYTHIEVDTSAVNVNLPIKQLTERELSIMKLLLEDVEIKDIPDKLQLPEKQNIYVFLGRLREKFGVVTNHGLVVKLCRMGIDAKTLGE